MAAGPYSADTLWVARAAHLIVEPHEDVSVVFHKLSGDTHILNFLSAAIVELLEEEPGTFAEVTGRVLTYLELDADDCPPSLVESTMLQLDDTGLIAPQNLAGSA